MRTEALAATLAAVLCATAYAAVTSTSGVHHYPGFPTRGHAILGPVQTLVTTDDDMAPPTLADAARARYGQVDGLALVRTAPLPFGDGALYTGAAFRWN